MRRKELGSVRFGLSPPPCTLVRRPGATRAHGKAHWRRSALQVLGGGRAARLCGQCQHGLAVPDTGESPRPGRGGPPELIHPGAPDIPLWAVIPGDAARSVTPLQ